MRTTLLPKRVAAAFFHRSTDAALVAPTVRDPGDMEPEHIIDSHGGLAATWELRQCGVGRETLTSALEQHRIIRVRQGWYARARLDDRLFAAARVGGRSTCATALGALGVWIEPVEGVHVAVRPNACQLRSPDDLRRRLRVTDPVRVHWDDDSAGSSRLRVEPLAALRALVSCVPADALALSADSLLHLRPDLKRGWGRFVAELPTAAAAELAHLDGVCESGTETAFWRRMRPRVPCLMRQVRIAGVGRVDFLIGERLIVEIDGAAYHTDATRFERDRRRDAALSALGYRVLRFSYRQVMFDWPAVEAAVLAAVARGDHW